jgi:chromosomal replication initiator protein
MVSKERVRDGAREKFMEEMTVCEPVVGEAAIEQIEKAAARRIGRERYEMWMEGKTRVSLSHAGVSVAAGNAFAANWIRGKLADEIAMAAGEVLGRAVAVTVEVDSTLQGGERGETAPASEPLAIASPKSIRPAQSGAVINPRHTFEEFVVGSCNQLAYHAAMRVAEHPGQQFNPLFVHGLCGMGKTHLLQAICQRFAKLHPNKKWLYLTGEGFTNEFLDGLRHNRTEAFRRRVRGADLLIIDDVHFLASKKATQEEFLHTFNQIGGDGSGRQIVLASDSAPRAMAAMAEPLVSRFVSGMVVRVDAPDLATRLEIVRRKAARNHWQLSEAVLMHVAQSSTGSVRELEGMLLQVVAGMTLIASGSADAAHVAASIKQRTTPTSGPIAATRIVASVATHFGVEESAVLSSRRDKTLAIARAAAMHLCRQHTQMSFPEIGRAMGNKNHSTVIAACQRVEMLVASGELIRWTQTDGTVRHQAMADILHELEAGLRRKLSA